MHHLLVSTLTLLSLAAWGAQASNPLRPQPSQPAGPTFGQAPPVPGGRQLQRALTGAVNRFSPYPQGRPVRATIGGSRATPAGNPSTSRDSHALSPEQRMTKVAGIISRVATALDAVMEKPKEERVQAFTTLFEHPVRPARASLDSYVTFYANNIGSNDTPRLLPYRSTLLWLLRVIRGLGDQLMPQVPADRFHVLLGAFHRWMQLWSAYKKHVLDGTPIAGSDQPIPKEIDDLVGSVIKGGLESCVNQALSDSEKWERFAQALLLDENPILPRVGLDFDKAKGGHPVGLLAIQFRSDAESNAILCGGEGRPGYFLQLATMYNLRVAT